MSDMRQYSKEFMKEFIELYKQLPSVWNLRSSEYRNRSKKYRGYQALVNKLKEVEPTCTKDTVVKKVNSIRSCYRKEKKKIQRSIEAGDEEIYKPQLWYFDLLSSFLEDHSLEEQLKREVEELIDDNTEETPQSPAPDNSDVDVYEDEEELNGVYVDTEAPIYSHDVTTTRQRQTLKRRDSDPLQVKPEKTARIESPIDFFAKAWAATLKVMPKQQQLLATKIINEVLFEAQMGNLNTGTRLCSLSSDAHAQSQARPSSSETIASRHLLGVKQQD